MIEFTVTRTTTAPIETAFDAMTDHRALADSVWMFRRSTLDREGTPAPNGAGAIRRLASFGLTFVEEIVDYERPTRWAYTLLSGAPIRDHLGTIQLREIATGTEISWHLRGALTIPGTDRPMRPVFKWFIDQLLTAATNTAEQRQRERTRREPPAPDRPDADA